MAVSSKIVDLRNLLAERYPQQPLPQAARLPTGLRRLDETTRGGLPKGAITEVASTHASAGSALMISALVQAAARENFFVALVDGRDSFDPEPLGNRALAHLLWVRCGEAGEAIKAADLLLRDGNFPLVILDLAFNPAAQLRKIPSTTWYRFQRLLEPMPTALLVLTRISMVSSAQLKLGLKSHWTLESLARTQAELLMQLNLEVRRSHWAGSEEQENENALARVG